MFSVLNKQMLAPRVKRLDIHAPHIAGKVLPGQFVSVCLEAGKKRVPLTVIDTDLKRGSIALIVQDAGEATEEIGKVSINDQFFSVLGPLGTPAHIEKKGTVVCIATGIGVAQMLPVARAFKAVGNKVIGIIGARTKKDLILEAQFRLACNRMYIATDDGSYERKGLATDVLKNILKEQKVHMAYAIGSVDMMEDVSRLAKDHTIIARVQINPVMVDCMGMCGSCRVKIGSKIVLACVDGPEFDGQKVDYGHLKVRMQAFQDPTQWNKQKSNTNPQANERRTFVKFLSDILSE